MNKDQLDKLDEKRYVKNKAAELREKDDAYNQEIRKKVLKHKQKTGSFDGLDWISKGNLQRVKDSFKGTSDNKLFKNLIKKLK